MTHGRRARPASHGPRYLAVAVALVAVLAGGYLVLSGTGGPAHPKAGRTPATRVAATSKPAPKPCTVSRTLVPSCGAWWGMYVPTSSGEDWSSAIAAQEQSLGRPLDIVEQYYDMGTGPDGVFPALGANHLARHHLLLFNWSAVVWSTGRRYTFGQVASGELDNSVILPEAERLKAFHHTVFLTLMAEADGSNGRSGTPAQYVAAWRHVHTLFAQAGVTNVVWVWTVEGWATHYAAISALYPGNAYVNWVGYDPYNFYTCHASQWASFPQTVGPFYQWSTTQAFRDKPLMLTEFGSDSYPPEPGLEATWYRSIPAAVARLPRLKALVQWNSAVTGCNLTIQNAPGVAQAYRQAGLAPYFTQLRHFLQARL